MKLSAAKWDDKKKCIRQKINNGIKENEKELDRNK